MAVKQERNWGPVFFFFNPMNSYPTVASNNTQSISNIQQQQMVRDITHLILIIISFDSILFSLKINYIQFMPMQPSNYIDPTVLQKNIGKK